MMRKPIHISPGYNTWTNRLGLTAFSLVLLVNACTVSGGEVDPTRPAQTVNLLFIHHSCGSNWLSPGDGGLVTALNENYYFVNEVGYGWSAVDEDGLGNRTDTGDWPEWFTDEKMPYVYAASQTSNFPNSDALIEPSGDNEIVMFKSCYPSSEVGDSIDDEKDIYSGLLSYFAAHPDKLFVLVTPPGETDVESHALTRELCDWLVSDEGWLADYALANVFVYDFYCTLSETSSHHRVVDDRIEHVWASNYDGTSPYHDGDDHPNSTGNRKATEEFVPLLNAAYI